MPVYLSIDLGILNLALCVVDIRTRSTEPKDIINDSKILSWNIETIGYNKEAMTFLIESISNQVDQLLQKYSVDQVLIERQHETNKQMVKLGYGLYGYLYGKKPTRFIKGTHKHLFCDAINYERDGKGYSTNKKTAVDAVTNIVQIMSDKHPKLMKKHVETFSDAKKQDDLADCLLQAFAYHMKPPRVVKRRLNPPKRRTKVTKKSKPRKKVSKPRKRSNITSSLLSCCSQKKLEPTVEILNSSSV